MDNIDTDTVGLTVVGLSFMICLMGVSCKLGGEEKRFTICKQLRVEKLEESNVYSENCFGTKLRK